MAKEKGKRTPRTDAQKRDDFKRLAAKKTETIIRGMAGLGNLFGHRYIHTPEQKAKIKEHLEAAGKALALAMEGKAKATAKIEL